MACVTKGECLYTILDITPDATADEIKKAYRKKALQSHPDRAGEAGAEDFKRAGFAYNILKEERTKSFYDKTGAWDNAEMAGEGSVAEFMQALFREVTEEDAQSFTSKYRNSAAEKDDLVAAFNKTKGSCLKTLGEIFFEDFKVTEEDRLVAAIQALIDEGRIVSTPLWEKTKITPKMKTTAAYKKRWAKRKEEAEEVDREKTQRKEVINGKNKKGTKQEQELCQALKEVMATEYDGMWASLAKKYKTEIPDVDEEEFEKAKARLAKGSTKAAAKKVNKKKGTKRSAGAPLEIVPDTSDEDQEQQPVQAPKKRRVVRKVVKKTKKN